ncbi:MAG: NAD-dependent epimerase/dehydratase family protein [Saccharofermentanales bacterium]|jgi:nucleoside-diphosphate-sugar epimerase
MQKLKVLLTGASGSFGKATLDLLLEEDKLEITAMALDTRKEKKILKPYLKKRKFKVIYGDIRDYQTAYQAVEQVDLILHLAALVSPAADKNPELAMEINYSGTVNLLQAIQQQKRTKRCFTIGIYNSKKIGIVGYIGYAVLHPLLGISIAPMQL